MAIFHLQKLKKGEHLYVLCEVATEVGFIVKGTFRVYYLIEGKESTRFLGCENILLAPYPAL